MKTFDDLVKSRRQWIDDVLIPWCKSSARKDLLLAEHEWTDLAGRPDPEMTLWKWAWERFPVLSHQGLQAINEANEISVVCNDGRRATGFPDSRMSEAGQLFLVASTGASVGPFAIDEIESITLVK